MPQCAPLICKRGRVTLMVRQDQTEMILWVIQGQYLAWILHQIIPCSYLVLQTVLSDSGIWNWVPALTPTSTFLPLSVLVSQCASHTKVMWYCVRAYSNYQWHYFWQRKPKRFHWRQSQTPFAPAYRIATVAKKSNTRRRTARMSWLVGRRLSGPSLGFGALG